MKRQAIVEAGVFVLLAAAGVAVRLNFQFIPNFAPVAALALFAGYFFHSRLAAIALPLSVMAITDLVIGAYHPAMMAVVYGALVMPVLFRTPLRRGFRLAKTDGAGSWANSATATLGLVGCSLAASVFFFVVTNFAHWIVYDMYDKTAAGLMQCFVAAIPFFRYTLAGDMTFAAVLFGSYAIAAQFRSVSVAKESAV